LPVGPCSLAPTVGRRASSIMKGNLKGPPTICRSTGVSSFPRRRSRERLRASTAGHDVAAKQGLRASRRRPACRNRLRLGRDREPDEQPRLASSRSAARARRRRGLRTLAPLSPCRSSRPCPTGRDGRRSTTSAPCLSPGRATLSAPEAAASCLTGLRSRLTSWTWRETRLPLWSITSPSTCARSNRSERERNRQRIGSAFFAVLTDAGYSRPVCSEVQGRAAEGPLLDRQCARRQRKRVLEQ
jgi:hypothetical protein